MAYVENNGMAMKTQVITFRLGEDTPSWKIFERWKEAGYKPRHILEMALQCFEGVEPEPQVEMNEAAIDQLQDVVQRLERVVMSIQQNGGEITKEHQAELENVLDKRFVQGMKSVVRPGFTQRPEEE